MSTLAEDLARNVVSDPTSFLTYLGTLEVEHQRLAEETETLTARNTEWVITLRARCQQLTRSPD